MLGLAGWLMWVIAVAMFLTVALGGLAFLRGVSRLRPQETIEPEDVTDLDVFLVCAECGTELHVTRLGQLQVPRHCGEPMTVVRRPRQDPVNN
jgi:hypothetical protein